MPPALGTSDRDRLSENRQVVGIQHMRDIDLTDQRGQRWRLSEARERGAVVLVFYRGDW